VDVDEDRGWLRSAGVEQVRCSLCGWISAPTSSFTARRWAARHRRACAIARQVDAPDDAHRWNGEREQSQGGWSVGQESHFVIGVEHMNAEVTVAVGGELDVDAAPRLREFLVQLSNSPEPPKRIVLDMAGLDFIESTGIGVLVGALKRLQHQGGDMVLRAPTPRVRTVLDLTGLTKLFDVEPASESATPDAPPDSL
jgi:anti-sigma B factor antagonist